MYISLSILITSLWISTAVLCIYKQQRVAWDTAGLSVFFALFFAPLYFIGAVIRQVIIEDWK